MHVNDTLPVDDRVLDSRPWVEVLGVLDGHYVVRLGWKYGAHVIAGIRLRFLRDELNMEVRDNPDSYVM